MRKGFTLIELIVVVSVIAVLAGIVVPTIGSLVDEAKDAKMVAEVKHLATSILQYEKHSNYLPYAGLPGGSVTYAYAYYYANTNQLNNLIVSYVGRRMIYDPWGEPFKYHQYSAYNPPARAVVLSFGRNRWTALWNGYYWQNRIEIGTTADPMVNGYYLVFK